MRRARHVAVFVTCMASACAVYDPSLLVGDKPGATPGASASGGTPASGGTSGGAGATVVSGASGSGATGGGSKNEGGANEGPGGTDGDHAGERGDGGVTGDGGFANDGGTDVGGAGGGGSGGAGGKPGGGSGGAGGSGGGSPTGDALVDDMQHATATATYANGPFGGVWSRALSGDMVWAAGSVSGMFVERADGATNLSLRIAAGCPSSGDCKSAPSDVEVMATLSSGAAVDVSAYKGVSFYVNRVSGTAGILRVAFDDGPSHQGSSSCNGTQADCGRESEYYVVPAEPYAVASGAWTKYQIPFSSFAKNCGWMCTRENSLNLREVYSIHFRVDRNTTGGAVSKIDLQVDDLYFYR